MNEIPVGPELDRAVAERVMGFTPLLHDFGSAWEGDDNEICESIPPYSTSIAAAWLVVEKMATLGHRLCLLQVRDRLRWHADFLREREYMGSGQTAPEAICRAALAALGASDDAPAP
jgi:hypothetical protein